MWTIKVITMQETVFDSGNGLELSIPNCLIEEAYRHLHPLTKKGRSTRNIHRKINTMHPDVLRTSANPIERLFGKYPGSSRTDVAKLLGVSTGSITFWRAGTAAPGQKHICAIAELLDEPASKVAADFFALIFREEERLLGGQKPVSPSSCDDDEQTGQEGDHARGRTN